MGSAALLRITGYGAAAAFCAVSLAANLRYGLSLGTESLDKGIYAAASVAADVFKIGLPLHLLALRAKCYRILSAAGFALALAALIAMGGLNTVAPGEARVVQLFGRYRGTIRTDGLRWVNPLTSRRRLSTRVRNHETPVMKVNDAYGNPIELAAVVVWRVEDTARAVFEVDDFTEFVETQTEAAVRHIAIEYPYDAHERAALEQIRTMQLVGGPETLRRELLTLAEKTGASELMLTTMMHGHDDRLRSFRLIAEALTTVTA